jgi:outer membrane protein OmpA-like peptidoglycan-associated protein
MRAAFLCFILALAGCAQVPQSAEPKAPVDPTVYADFRVVPRAPDIAAYPAVREHVWVPVPVDRVFITVKVVNHTVQRPATPAPAIAAAAASPSLPIDAPVVRPPSIYTTVVHFAFDRYNLDSNALVEIERLVQKVGKSFPGAEIVVDGFTDAIGSTSYNQQLSIRRANTVREFLISKGASPSRLSLAGKGKESPAASNSTPAGRALNRRATVQVTTD